MPLLVFSLTMMILLLLGAPGRAECDDQGMRVQLERAWEAREDHFFWEDLDEHEAAADLDRFITRLESLVKMARECHDASLEKRAADALAEARRRAT